MTESISRKELCGYLSLLRRQLAGQSLFPAPNVIFLKQPRALSSSGKADLRRHNRWRNSSENRNLYPPRRNGGKLFALSLRLQGAKGRAHAQLSGKQ